MPSNCFARLKTRGLLHLVGDHHALGPLEAVVVPRLLQQMIEQRLSRFGEGRRSHAEIRAAVIGHEFSLGLWRDATGAADYDLAETLALALEARVFDERPDRDSVRFSHALWFEKRYTTALSRCIAETGIRQLPRRSSHDRSLIQHFTADHLLRAGDQRAVEWLIRALDRAERLYAWLTAAEYFDRAQDR